jgi:hypothetical protein
MADPLGGNRASYPQSSMTNWNFREWHVGSDQGGKNTNAITSENVYVAAGPARLSDVGADFTTRVVPLGMVESFSMNQQKMVQQIRELGSRRSYHVSSYATGNVSLSRVMYAQASLLKMLTMANGDIEDIDNPAGPDSLSYQDYGSDSAVATNDASFWINLQSEVFDRPIGLLIYMLDQRNIPYGSCYIEDAMIQNHGFSLAAAGVTISEQVSMMCDRILPVSVRAA